MEELNPRQQQFIACYLESGNATRCYMEAYGETDEAVAASNASHLTRNHKVARTIATINRRAMEAAQVTVTSIVEQLRVIAFADVGQVVEWDEKGVTIKPSTELTPAQRAIISEISETPTQHGRKKSLKFYNRLTALDMLMKHTGGYVTPRDIVNAMTPEELEALAARLLTKADQSPIKLND